MHGQKLAKCMALVTPQKALTPIIGHVTFTITAVLGLLLLLSLSSSLLLQDNEGAQ